MANNCIGLKISRNNNVITLDQKSYILKVLEKFNMKDCKPSKIVMDPNQKLTKEMCPKTEQEKADMENVPYQEAIGSLLYLANGTRPDLCFVVNYLSSFNNNPGRPHWNAVKKIFRYLKGTLNYKLKYSKDTQDMIGFCDADWANNEDDRRSCSGFVFILQGGAISWNSKRQETVALSTTEAEYMALSTTLQEALWLRQFLEEFGLQINKDATLIYCDNRSAINLTSLNIYHGRSKHIDVRHHFVREKCMEGSIEVEHKATEEMVADILTKPLFSAKQDFCISNMGLHDIIF